MKSASSIQQNPLLHPRPNALPAFDAIQPEHVLPALERVLGQARAEIAALCTQEQPCWESLMLPLSLIEERIDRTWGPIAHLNAVMDDEHLRDVHRKGVAMMAEWRSELGQNRSLFAAISRLRESAGFQSWPEPRRRVVEHTLRDFELSGARLSGEKRRRFRAIQMRLAELATLFEQHVLDATRSFSLHLTDRRDVEGLPESVLVPAAERAAAQGKGGWLFTLDAPSYVPFMQHARRRDLRELMYRAHVTRASEGALDNGPLIEEILCLRQEAARLLGFPHYAACSLATKMASDAQQVESFLLDLAARSRPFAERELAELRLFARDELGLEELHAWDIPFASEHLRRHLHAISQEDLKPYFPEPRVLEGLFSLVERLYGLTIRQDAEAPVWHPDVRFYRVFQQGRPLAGFYLDLYARPHKRGGAWMDECLARMRYPDGTLQLPVAYIVCNFESPTGGQPALWSHDEVITLFHEFGHGLHHMLTEMSDYDVSGIRGVPWDAVELPSQFMENFCWHKPVVDMMARHVATGAPLPDELFERMLAARNFQSAMQMLRQIEFALFDLRLHMHFGADGGTVRGILAQVRKQVAVLEPPSFNRFECSFSHIFAGGYAAGYYAYKWAEVLSADAFSAFEEDGVLNPETADRFRRCILACGGGRDIMDAFVDFRGRMPSVDALLRHAGLAERFNPACSSARDGLQA